MKKKNHAVEFYVSYFPLFEFSFSHKTRKTTLDKVIYNATYEHSEKTLTLYHQPDEPTLTIGGDTPSDKRYAISVNDKAWKIFSENATFEEINPRVIAFATPDFYLNYLERDKIKPLPDFPDDFQHLQDCYEQHLQALRDNQDYFITSRKNIGFDRAITALMQVLWSANWHKNKEEREKARELLIDNLIPSHKVHKMKSLPHYKILIPMREVMNKLAEHLSKKYKCYLPGTNISDLLDWAKDNDLRIHAIADKDRSMNSINQLMKKPHDYVNRFMAARYGISIRTLKSSFKSSIFNRNIY